MIFIKGENKLINDQFKKQYLGYILAALASVPVYGMAIADHNAFHNILTEMQDGKKI